MNSEMRAVETLGVAGLLDGDCRVFYENLFSSKNMGKVCDLLAARLRKTGLDELKLRAVVLFQFFEAYRVLRAQTPANEGASVTPRSSESDDSRDLEDRPLSVPIVLECGVDSRRLAIGVSFGAGQHDPAYWDELAASLADRVKARTPQDAFEELVCQIQAASDGLVMRIQPSSARVELVAFIELSEKPGGAGEAGEANDGRFRLVVLPEKLEQAPSAQEYTALGDVDYEQLLKEDVPGKKLKPPSSGKVLLEAVGDPEDSATTVKGASDRSGGSTSVKGEKDEKDEFSQTFKGETAEQDQSKFVFRGGGKSGESGESEVVYRQKIEALQSRLAELEAARGGASAGGSDPEQVDEGDDDDTEEEEGDSKARLAEMLKKMWPFKNKVKAKRAKDEEGDEDGGESDGADEEDEGVGEGAEEIEKLAARLEAEGADPEEVIKRLQADAAKIADDVKSEKAKKMLNGMMNELVAERSKLQEMSKKLTISVRQKEIEFRNKEEAYRGHLRKAEELIKAKNTALERSKEQLSQAMSRLSDLDEAKPGTVGAAAATEDPGVKHKLGQYQRLLAASKEETADLKKRIEEMQKQIVAARAAANSKSATDAAEEAAALQSKLDRAQKQVDEYKRLNQQLTERVNEGKKDKISSANVEETKKRLEAAMKMMGEKKREVEDLQIKFATKEAENEKLKGDLAKLQSELKAFKGESDAGGSSSKPAAGTKKAPPATGKPPAGKAA